MDPNEVIVEYMPKITDDQLWGFYVRNDICEIGFGKKIAVKPLYSNCVIAGAFFEDRLVGIIRAHFDGVSAYISEFCLELELQGNNLVYDNGSLIEKDPYGIAKKLGETLVENLRKQGNTSISATILENCEEEVYRSFGMSHNPHHLDYKIDERPYVK